MFFSDDFFGKSYTPWAVIKGPEITALIDFIWYNRKEILTLNLIMRTNLYKEVASKFKADYRFLLDEAIKQMIVDVNNIENY